MKELVELLAKHLVNHPDKVEVKETQGDTASVIELRDDEDPLSRGVVVHDEGYQTPAYASALATLARPVFPIPVGVFREVDLPRYEDSLQRQVDDAVSQRGAGDLDALLHSGETWTVEA